MKKENINKEEINGLQELNNAKLSNGVDLKSDYPEEPYQTVVEKERIEINNAQKRSAKRATISIAVISLCAVGGMTLSIYSQNHPENAVLRVIVWVIVGIAVASLIFFSIFNRRIDKPDYQSYINNSYIAIGKDTFKDTRYSEASFDPKEKVEVSEIYNDGVYQKIESLISRAVMRGKYENHSFKVCECGIYKEIKRNKKVTNFVGKLLQYSNDLHFKGRYIAISKSSKEVVDHPDNLDDLVIVYENKNFTLFGEANSKYKEDLGTKVIPALNKIEIDDCLMNMTVCFWAGKTNVYLSYDNSVVMLPFADPYDNKGAEHFKRDLLDIFDALSSTMGE